MSTGAANGYVLCIDDEEPALLLRRMVLEKDGYAVLSATDGRQAIELFRKHAVSLVISDHLLGNETGIELAAEMKRLKPNVPIVILSGMVPDRMANIDCFILKSEPPKYVLAKLRDLLRRSSQ